MTLFLHRSRRILEYFVSSYFKSRTTVKNQVKCSFCLSNKDLHVEHLQLIFYSTNARAVPGAEERVVSSVEELLSHGLMCTLCNLSET